MAAFLEILLTFPTVLFSVPLALSLFYWLFVIVGAIDIEFLDAVTGAGADGAVEGAVEGATEGVADAAAHGVAEGVADAAAHGVAEGVADAAAHGVAEGVADSASDGAIEGAVHASGGLAMVLSLLRIGKVPITITFSLIFLSAWFFSAVGMAFLGTTLTNAGLLGTLAKTGLAIASFLAGGALTSFVTRPLAKIFGLQEAVGSTQLIGQTAKVSTFSVSERHGQATRNHEDADLLLQVRCGGPNDLTKGDEVRIIGYNESNNTYKVRPLRKHPLLETAKVMAAPPPADDPLVEERELETET
ncbi:MAG: hypothetical protein A2289_23000 [Deltaproteobacteria bacterium RIFOXYA12_FULL_58_15]|nr:MAG: hypothetical protein A2289_23000 [Deltaproteobacteria bacterium RIFOXYA12_FULL_58_15]OGR08871.1 MAG: hypothetical protein A2341_27735 [Deltaproteobacteria bacterium RIFOXYB12_FULL_58_9]